MLVPLHPIGLTSHSRNAVNSCILINFEVGPTHGPFTVYPWHCLQLVHWMLKAHQTSFTVKNTPCWKGSKGFGTSLFYDF
uniref:Uncharacterized protein n=1 Tax=Lotus japonicus TaxID=34305 RepID=I3SUR6_LOTJA|nr:unknown [Lotus japonicus]